MNVVLLAGTGDAAVLAARLAAVPGVNTIASFAGRTAHPFLPPNTNVRIGGFGGVPGLCAYLTAHAVDAVIDATHPFAQQMHRNAAQACAFMRIPIISYVRPEWRFTTAHRVREATDMAEAAVLARAHGKRIFLTVGRQELKSFAACEDRWFLIRSIEPPRDPLPQQHLSLLARGPFSLEQELALMREHRVDLLVSKNSGGNATYAKIEAAQTLGLPIVAVRRPARSAVPTAHTYDEIIFWTHSLQQQVTCKHDPLHAAQR